MDDLTFVSKFDPINDDPVEFLERLRPFYDESYGKWYQSFDDNGDGMTTLDLRTGGWSENEAVVEAMLENHMLRMLCYYSWTRGGQHVFTFDRPTNTQDNGR